jgi:hypothetical protein
MTDEEAVYAERRQAQAEGREISDAAARVIATWWHAVDNGEAALRFVADGSIPNATEVWRGMVWPNLYDHASTDDKLALDMLCTYLLNRPDRGPVPGWERLWIR